MPNSPFKKFILFLLLTTTFLQADLTDQNPNSDLDSHSISDVSGGDECPARTKDLALLEFKAGYFLFSNSKMRRVYNQGGLDVQICGSYPLLSWLHIYGSLEYLIRHGKSLGGREKTTLWEIPLSLGLKPVIPISSKVNYYFTLGPRYFFLHVDNHSDSLDRDINWNGLGGFLNTGFNFFPLSHLLVDIFAEYSYNKIHFQPSKSHVYKRKIQTGGFTFGAGLGYAF